MHSFKISAFSMLKALKMHQFNNIYAGQEVTVRTGHRTTDLFQIGKGVHQGCILSSCLAGTYTGL